MMQLLLNRKSISFELLHSCKLPWHCIAATPGLQRAADVGAAMLVPAFLTDGEAAYQLRLDALVQVLPAADRASFSRHARDTCQANDLEQFLRPAP